MTKIIPFQILLNSIVNKECRTQDYVNFIGLSCGFGWNHTVYFLTRDIFKLLLDVIDIVWHIMVILGVYANILMCCDSCLKVEDAWTVLKSHIAIRNRGFVKYGIGARELSSFKVYILSIVDFCKRWVSDSINTQLHVHRIHGLDNIIDPTSSILIISSCQHSLTQLKGLLITNCTNKPIGVGNSIIRI